MLITDKEFEAVFASTKTKCIAFSLDKSPPLTPVNSSILGLPYWEKETPNYPENSLGPLRLLAQINFAELQEFSDIISNFPKSGLLQFFMPPVSISSPASPTLDRPHFIPSDYFNNSFNTAFNKKPKPVAPPKNLLENYEVRFHPAPLLDNHFLPPNLEEINSVLPINGTILSPLKLIPNLKEEYCGLGDEYWSYYLYEHTTMNEVQEKRLFNCINGGVKLNGYSYFHATDPRPIEGYNRANPWVLLLQIDSIYIAENLESSNQINLAGNKGIISFFIRQQDLIEKNFNSQTIMLYRDKGYRPYNVNEESINSNSKSEPSSSNKASPEAIASLFPIVSASV